jgi:hypothetical protein
MFIFLDNTPRPELLLVRNNPFSLLFGGRMSAEEANDDTGWALKSRVAPNPRKIRDEGERGKAFEMGRLSE